MPFELLRQSWQTYRFVSTHPLTAKARTTALLRTLRWQLGSRILPHAMIVDWVAGSKLVARRGRTGATGNIYTGLHEYDEMSFLLHFLRAGELFVDIGANIGTYTVLASAVCGAKVISFEPSPSTYEELVDNVKINRVEGLSESWNMALGEREGSVTFTDDLDTVNHVLSSSESQHRKTVNVPVKRLDDVLAGRQSALIKLDVEGYELAVLKGATTALAGTRALIVELNGSGLRYGVRDEDIADLLASHGFTPCAYDPASRRLRTITERKNYGNVIYVKDVAEAASKLRSAERRAVYGQEV